jgi:hypothetical protein
MRAPRRGRALPLHGDDRRALGVQGPFARLGATLARQPGNYAKHLRHDLLWSIGRFVEAVGGKSFERLHGDGMARRAQSSELVHDCLTIAVFREHALDTARLPLDGA